MSFTFCTSQAIIQKAGANTNTTAAASGSLIKAFYDQAESETIASANYDFVTNTPNTTWGSQLLGDAISDRAAIKLINYDLSSYYSRAEAQTMLSVLDDQWRVKIKTISDQNITGKI